MCKLVWAFPNLPVDTSGVIRFQTSGTLLLRFVASSHMVTLSDLCLFQPPQWAVLLHLCWQADLFALWPGYGWGIGGSTQANTFLCPTLNWLSSDINFPSLSLRFCPWVLFQFFSPLFRWKYNKQYLFLDRNGSTKKCWDVWNTDLMWVEAQPVFHELVSCLYTVDWNLKGTSKVTKLK